MSSTMTNHGIVIGQPDAKLRIMENPQDFFAQIMETLEKQHRLPLVCAGAIWTPPHPTPPCYNSGVLVTETSAWLMQITGNAKGGLFACPIGHTTERLGDIGSGSWAYIPQGMACYFYVDAFSGSHLSYNGMPVRLTG